MLELSHGRNFEYIMEVITMALVNDWKNGNSVTARRVSRRYVAEGLG